MTAMAEDPNSSPLTWDEARCRLRSVLQEYLDEQTPRRRDGAVEEKDESKDVHGPSNRKSSFIAQCIRYDLDMWIVSMALSLVLLVVSCLSFVGRSGIGGSYLNASAGVTTYAAQVAGSSILTIATLFSLWMVRRRRFLCLTDSDSAKRQEVSRFLRRFDAETAKIQAWSSHESVKLDGAALGLTGTSLTDLYPVFRKQNLGDDSYGTWCRVPSLLLVEGDLIALQIGDVSPAECAAMDGTKIKLTAGQNVSLETVNETTKSLTSGLPPARTTLPVDSEHLLTLSNGMRVFQVSRAPMYSFIRHKQSMLLIIRKSLFCCIV